MPFDAFGSEYEGWDNPERIRLKSIFDRGLCSVHNDGRTHELSSWGNVMFADRNVLEDASLRGLMDDNYIGEAVVTIVPEQGYTTTAIMRPDENGERTRTEIKEPMYRVVKIEPV